MSWLVLVTVTNGSLMVSQSGLLHKEDINAQQDRHPPWQLLTRVATIRLVSPTAHGICPRSRVPMPVLLLRHVVSLEASGPAMPALLILFGFVNPLHCPALCFLSVVVITYVAALSERGISLQVPFLALPSAHAANACLASSLYPASSQTTREQ